MENKDALKNKYYFDFLVNFINKNSNVLGEHDLRSFNIEYLVALAEEFTDDIEHKWILSDEYSKYLNEISKDDKTLPMTRVILPDNKRFWNDIANEISDTPDLSSYSTKALFDELIKRGGVEAHWLNPESSYSLDIKLPDSCHDSVHFDGRGPVWIIFNYD